MAKVLVTRLSALGDVAMIVPVLYSVAMRYPEDEFVVMSRPFMEALFQQMPSNVSFIGIDPNSTKYGKGLKALNGLYNEFKHLNITHVADLHNVLRSKFVRYRFKLAGVKTAAIDKGKKGKRALVRRNNKIMKSQKSSFSRYQEVFAKLGFPAPLNFLSIYGENRGDIFSLKNIVGDKNGYKWIGIAPFAKHKGKIYPLNLMEQVLAHLSKDSELKVFLFGGGAKEKEIVDEWVRKYPSLISMIGKLNMQQELAFMSHLDVMLSMDSANMHLASLVNVPVISVWGATHPYAGFMGWMQLPTNTIQVDLPCRPCSVFGQKECWRKDYACLYQITPDRIIAKVEGLVK